MIQRFVYETIDSTNREAFRLANNEGAQKAPFFVLSKTQTEGKGRVGRKWESEEGGLYFSLYLRPSLEIDKASMLTLIMAVAVAKAIHKCLQVKLEDSNNYTLEIKWPNDIVLNGKKVVGILTELRCDQDGYAVVIGTGVNLSQTRFAEELQEKATSMKSELGISISTEILLKYIEEYFLQEYTTFEKIGDLSFLRETYESMLANKDRQVRVLDPKEEFLGIARGIDEMGRLLVETKDGQIQKVYAGEVSVRGLLGYVD